MDGVNGLFSKITEAILSDHFPDRVETKLLFEIRGKNHGFVFAKLEIKREILNIRCSMFDVRFLHSQFLLTQLFLIAYQISNIEHH